MLRKNVCVAVLGIAIWLVGGCKLQGQSETHFAADHGYWAMIGGRLDKWDFHHDGTFLHEGVASSVGASVRSGARGTYRMEGDKLILNVQNTTTAFATGGDSGNSAQGAGTSAAAQTATLTIKLIGQDGADGIVLNGTKYGIRHGW
jgi:hypothetical protein